MPPLVSVITPTYNHHNFIEDCIQSVRRQTFANWEQIIIDDGSTDGTGEIARRLCDTRVRYVRQDNQGPFALAKTYNHALALARGSLIAILEGDDFWPSDKLEAQVPTFADNKVVLSYGHRIDVDAAGRPQRRKTRTARKLTKVSADVLSNVPLGTITKCILREEGRSLVHPCTVMIRRSALEEIGGFQYALGLPQTDYPTFLELSLIGSFCFVPKTLGYLRRHQHSITVNYARKIHESVCDVARRFVNQNQERLHISSKEWFDIEASWREAEGSLSFCEGRALLLQSRWTEARDHFHGAFASRDAVVRLAALAGLVSSWAHLNLESVMRLAGRADLRVHANEEQRS